MPLHNEYWQTDYCQPCSMTVHVPSALLTSYWYSPAVSQALCLLAAGNCQLAMPCPLMWFSVNCREVWGFYADDNWQAFSLQVALRRLRVSGGEGRERKRREGGGWFWRWTGTHASCPPLPLSRRLSLSPANQRFVTWPPVCRAIGSLPYSWPVLITPPISPVYIG